MQKVLAVLPAYNEAESLPALLINFERESKGHDWDLSVLVVNDGSSDNTAAVVQDFKSSLSIQLIDHKINGGLGKVIRDGFIYACSQLTDEDIVITMDADNSHHPNLIEEMVQKIRQGNDIVIASRYRRGAHTYGLSAFRSFTSLMAGSLFLIFASLKGVRDYTCGYRAYKAGLLKKGLTHFGAGFIEENGFSCMVEILLKLNVFKPRYCEVPLILRYDLKKGASKMNVGKTIKQTLLVLWQYRFTSRFK